jgi:hypothetical protein
MLLAGAAAEMARAVRLVQAPFLEILFRWLHTQQA